MKKIMVFGTFDLLHKGHKQFLLNSKNKGEYLIVVVGRDDNVLKFKGKRPVQDEDTRLQHIIDLDFVDEAVLGEKDHDYFKIIDEMKPNIICLGYDQKDLGLNRMIDDKKLDLKTIRIKPYKEKVFKTTILRKLFNKVRR